MDTSQCDWWVPAIYDQTGVWLVSDAVIGYSPELQLARHCQGSGNPDENVLVVRSVISSLIRVTYTVAFLLCRWAFPPFLALGSGFACQPYIDSPQSLWPGFDSRLGHMTALPFLHFFCLFFILILALFPFTFRTALLFRVTERRIFILLLSGWWLLLPHPVFSHCGLVDVVESFMCNGLLEQTGISLYHRICICAWRFAYLISIVYDPIYIM